MMMSDEASIFSVKGLSAMRGLRRQIQELWAIPRNRILLLFGIEGILYQFVSSVTGFGNNLYATNLGATDTQIGLVQTIPNLVAVLLMLPSGIWGERTRYSKTVPVAVLTIMGLMFIGYATVPLFGALRMNLFFVFLGLTVGLMAIYNAQWQNFFGDVVALDDRNQVFTFRNRFMFFVGTVTPLFCGIAMSSVSESEDKLMILRIFYYISAAFLLIQAVSIARIPCQPRQTSNQRFTLRDVGETIGQACRYQPFRRFFVVILCFYLSWHMDFSMWYLGEVNYIGMTEAHLSTYNAMVCVAQLLSIGFFARLNQKKSVHYTIIYGALGLWLCPLAMVIGCLSPVPLRPLVFMTLGTVGGLFQGCISLCVVQMLLQAVPVKNRSLTISLYTIVITLSNSLLPLFGVQLYTWLGSNYQAVIQFNLIVAALRAGATLLLIRRYQWMKKQNLLFKTPQD